MQTEIDFAVEADQATIVLEIIEGARAFLEVFTKMLVRTNAFQED